MELKFKWITVKEAVELVLSDKFKNGGSLDFTLDSYEWNHDDPNFEPTGWYGIARNNSCFDGISIVMGYYGGGIEASVNCNDLNDYYEETFEDVLFAFLNYLQNEGDRFTPDSLICIDADYPNKYES